MINFMLDIETLGTKPGCAVLAIAAVPFGLGTEDMEPFYVRIAKDTNREVCLTVEQSTLRWWARQSPAAYAEAFGGSTHIRDALQQLRDYLEPYGKVRVWGNGASFDAPILEAAFAACGLETPWHYRDSMCYRTLKNLYPAVPYTTIGTAHNALDDARSQAEHLRRIFHFMELKQENNNASNS